MNGFQKHCWIGSTYSKPRVSISSSHFLTRMSRQSCRHIFRVTELTRNPTGFTTKREAIEGLQGKTVAREYLR
jgi:hypothetical protein